MKSRWHGCLAALLCLGHSGCGAVVYTVDVASAETAFAGATAAGGDASSPYEYYAAREYLTKAREEASEASYEDAIRFANEAARLSRLAEQNARASGVVASAHSPSTEPNASAPNQPSATESSAGSEPVAEDRP